MRKLGWAVVGLGHLAQDQILPTLAGAQRSRLAALVSGDPGKARRLAAEYGVGADHVYDYDRFDRVRDDPDVDAVYVALPTGMHAEYTIRSARAGKHVLCEKPMASTVEDCRRMIDECRRAGRTLMIAYRVRYEPYNQAAIALARSGELGAIKVITDDHGFPISGPGQWRLTRALGGGGALMDIGVYGVQAARYLAGEEPIEARATMWSTPGDPRFGEVEETVAFQLTFPSGVVASCTSSYGYAHQNRYRVVCADGWFELEPATSYRGLRMIVRRGGQTEERRFEEVNHFARQIDHFAECVAEGKVPIGLTPS